MNALEIVRGIPLWARVIAIISAVLLVILVVIWRLQQGNKALKEIEDRDVKWIDENAGR